MRPAAYFMLALLGLSLSATEAQPQGKEVQDMAKTPTTMFQQWVNPDTGEKVSLRFDGQQTTLERGGKVRTTHTAPFSEASSRIGFIQQLEAQWTPMLFISWWENLLMQRGSTEAARQEFLKAGFPQALWDELQAQDSPLRPKFMEGTNVVPEAYASSTTVTQIDTEHSLLWNPPPVLKSQMIQVLGQEMHFAPTPADASFHMQRQDLQKEGFIQVSARRPDGSLWLPDSLEPYRAKLLTWEKPVMRPVVTTGQPAPWDSKFGGVPYRPKGSVWPTQSSGRPLLFLAQIDLGVANAAGHLPDLPRRGLLQFFMAYADDLAAEGGASAANQVRYWPEVQRDSAALDFTEPTFEDEFEVEVFNPPERALKFIPDTEIPSLLDSRLQWLNAVLETTDEVNTHGNGHRLGGHAMLINAYVPPEEDWQLLFQFDGDDVAEVIYDDGVGLGGWLGFFIRASDLKKLDFSRVRLEMDAF